jgi:hypothetical protein
MICAACRHPIPDKMMACPACASRKSAQALRAFQLDPLRKIAAGRAELVVRAVAGKRHVQLFGAEQAFCGVAISPSTAVRTSPTNPTKWRRSAPGAASS